MNKLTQEMIDWVRGAEENNIQDATMKFEYEFDLPNVRIAERLYDLALLAAYAAITGGQ